MKGVCLALASMLAILLWLADAAAPPLLMASELDKVEDGTVVRVQGIVSKIRVYDSGYISLILADLTTGETARVLYLPSTGEDFVSEVSIGDEVLVAGIVALESSIPVVFAHPRGTTVVSKSAHAMSVELLCANWRLFEYDRLNVSGVIEIEADSGALWLADPLGGARLRLMSKETQISAAEGALATIDCTLLMDVHTMSLYLRAWNISLLQI